MRRSVILVPAVIGLGLLAYAHADQLERRFPVFGFWRPFLGYEHLLAAVGVGLWGAILRGSATWRLLGAFLAGAILGWSLAWNGPGPLPFVGLMLLLSIVALVLATLLPIRIPVGKAAALVSMFGLYHGYSYASDIEAVTPAWHRPASAAMPVQAD